MACVRWSDLSPPSPAALADRYVSGNTRNEYSFNMLPSRQTTYSRQECTTLLPQKHQPVPAVRGVPFGVSSLSEGLGTSYYDCNVRRNPMFRVAFLSTLSFLCALLSVRCEPPAFQVCWRGQKGRLKPSRQQNPKNQLLHSANRPSGTVGRAGEPAEPSLAGKRGGGSARNCARRASFPGDAVLGLRSWPAPSATRYAQAAEGRGAGQNEPRMPSMNMEPPL